MAFSTDTLDHHVFQRASLLDRVRKLDGLIADDIAGLQEKLHAGESTGLPLQDWAILAHGEEYREYLRTAMLVQSYLAAAAYVPPPVLVAVYAEFSPDQYRVLYMLHLGVLEGEGVTVALADRVRQMQVSCSNFYTERGHVLFGDGHPRLEGNIHQGPIVLDPVITPALCLDVDKRYFSSQTETTPHLTSRLQAGTDAVRAYLREFWHSLEPPEAIEFFRSITPPATEARP